jgi:hypothetical protein
MNHNKTFAFIPYGVNLLGVVYLALGIIGFLPVDAINPHHLEGIGARYLLNLVTINTLHNIVHLLVGLTALVAARTLAGAQLWGKIGGAVLLLLFVIGMVQLALQGFPVDHMVLGLVALNSPGHILHLVSGGIALYLGLVRIPAPSAR